jgi:hypothetical protein
LNPRRPITLLDRSVCAALGPRPRTRVQDGTGGDRGEPGGPLRAGVWGADCGSRSCRDGEIVREEILPTDTQYRLPAVRWSRSRTPSRTSQPRRPSLRSTPRTSGKGSWGRVTLDVWVVIHAKWKREPLAPGTLACRLGGPVSRPDPSRAG